MKLFLTIFLTIFLTSALSGFINLSGGDDYALFDTYFDRVKNLFYAPVQGSCSIATSKGKKKGLSGNCKSDYLRFQNEIAKHSFSELI